MNPLLSGPVVIRPGAKLVDAVGLKGKRFSNVDEEGDTLHVAVFSPANCALNGLIFAGPRSLHASTMLCEQLPAVSTLHPLLIPVKLGIATSVGIGTKATSPRVVRRPS